ncbi:MAG: RHS repeat-associated core domain-containing protein, partial [Lachnospiraceae bacterium]|nr:RHS repeat-associated core domain-containing protein [Lachnospiraceae bacterium]
VGLLDGSGTKVVSYTYDSWGKLISTTGTLASTLGADNPLRYRGYYYDVETGLYYLQSRYYDPETGRFINANSLISTGQSIIGFNMFAYCLNNPVNRVDFAGNMSMAAAVHLSPELRLQDEGLGGAIGTAALGQVATVGAVAIAGYATATVVASESAEIYDFAKSLVNAALSTYDDKQPRVHHIVPWGEFSNRNEVVQDQLHKAQAMIEKAEINIFTDFNNLMIVSHGLHKSMHTDQYLLWVSNTILATDGAKESIYSALFLSV